MFPYEVKKRCFCRNWMKKLDKNPLLLGFPQEYTNKQCRGYWKGTKVNSITTATISIHKNLQ